MGLQSSVLALHTLLDSYSGTPRGGRGGRGKTHSTPTGRGSIRSWLGTGSRHSNGSDEMVQDPPSTPTNSGNPQTNRASQLPAPAAEGPSTAPTLLEVLPGSERNKRTVQNRSPNTEENARSTRRRLNEFDLGGEFARLEDVMREKIGEITARAPEDVRSHLQEAMKVLADAIVGTMNSISHGVRHERLERETLEDKMEERVAKLQEDVKEQQVILDSLTEIRIKSRIKESTKEMEDKVQEAQCAVKLMDVDIGKETTDRREIVRKTIDSLRAYVKEDSLRWLDRIVGRTRIIIMGRGTTRRERQNGYTVPTLLQCRDRRDAEDLDGMLREAGWFSTFHWPQEILELVNHARDEVRRQGYSERDYYVKVRPERREGGTMLKAEVKPKTGGRYSLKGLYACSPLHRVLWDSIPGVFMSRLVERS